MYPLEVHPVSDGHSSFCSAVMPQQVRSSMGMLPYCRQPWNLITHVGISVFATLPLGCIESSKINSNCT